MHVHARLQYSRGKRSRYERVDDLKKNLKPKVCSLGCRLHEGLPVFVHQDKKMEKKKEEPAGIADGEPACIADEEPACVADGEPAEPAVIADGREEASWITASMHCGRMNVFGLLYLRLSPHCRKHRHGCWETI